MLFDLRGRGRRRTVQVIYVSLAILMGGGLVFFGIGGSVSGGLLDGLGLTDSGAGNTSGGSDILANQEKAAEKRARANPRDARAWAVLARSRYNLAGQGENYDQQRGAFTTKGRRQLAEAARAWERYLALEPPKPDASVALLMSRAYGPSGLNQPANAVRAAEIAADAQPSSQAYYQLALYAYAAGQTRKGDLAGRRAVELAPPDARGAVKAQVDAAKAQVGRAAGRPHGGDAPPPPPG
jgi:hypothetical protein